mgnify:CR=1 FL=1
MTIEFTKKMDIDYSCTDENYQNKIIKHMKEKVADDAREVDGSVNFEDLDKEEAAEQLRNIAEAFEDAADDIEGLNICPVCGKEYSVQARLSYENMSNPDFLEWDYNKVSKCKKYLDHGERYYFHIKED